MKKQNIKEFLQYCKNVHIQWAEYFEDNPEIEKEYVSTDEWDDSKKHRKFARNYQQVIDYIKYLEKCEEKNEQQ